MSETTVTDPAAGGDVVPLAEVEFELSRRVKALQGAGEAPVQQARMSNLVIYCDRSTTPAAAQAIPAVVAMHPARVLLLAADAEAPAEGVSARVAVQAHPLGAGRRLFSEVVTLHAGGADVQRLPFAVRELVVGDLPINLWWAVPQPPALAGVLFHDLAEDAEQVVYDSIGWPDPARGVVATARWLAQLEGGPRSGMWRVASDLNWRRLKGWRRLLTQATDPARAPGLLEGISELSLEHGPHAVVQAWELVSWGAYRLGWRVQAGGVRPGVEIAWQLDGPKGPVRVRLRRLEEGPPRILKVQITSAPCSLTLVEETEQRLAVVPDCAGEEPRTVTVPPQPLAEMVGRQLSDRERDPVFRESMAVAGALSESVLDHS